MALVVRTNYGDDSIALIAFLAKQSLPYEAVYVVYIDTGWAAPGWEARVKQEEAFVRRCGFEPLRLFPTQSFEDMVIDRQNFPSPKFQWCAGFLKGLPLLEWLDQHDPSLDWTLAVAKRQALYRRALPENIASCEYHGERKVIHPILNMSETERDSCLKDAGFVPLKSRSKECEPCVNSTWQDLAEMDPFDLHKTDALEQKIRCTFLGHKKGPDAQGIIGAYTKALEKKEAGEFKTEARMDAFTMGCGDPFGCGL